MEEKRSNLLQLSLCLQVESKHAKEFWQALNAELQEQLRSRPWYEVLQRDAFTPVILGEDLRDADEKDPTNSARCEHKHATLHVFFELE